jgi:hypothetical protein
MDWFANTCLNSPNIPSGNPATVDTTTDLTLMNAITDITLVVRTGFTQVDVGITPTDLSSTNIISGPC